MDNDTQTDCSRKTDDREARSVPRPMSLPIALREVEARLRDIHIMLSALRPILEKFVAGSCVDESEVRFAITGCAGVAEGVCSWSKQAGEFLESIQTMDKWGDIHSVVCAAANKSGGLHEYVAPEQSRPYPGLPGVLEIVEGPTKGDLEAAVKDYPLRNNADFHLLGIGEVPAGMLALHDLATNWLHDIDRAAYWCGSLALENERRQLTSPDSDSLAGAEVGEPDAKVSNLCDPCAISNLAKVAGVNAEALSRLLRNVLNIDSVGAGKRFTVSHAHINQAVPLMSEHRGESSIRAALEKLGFGSAK